MPNFFNKYPYTDFHELNLDWVLNELKKLAEQMTDFINNNTITYADPIDWNIMTQYAANTIVIDDENKIAYLSKQPVPAGVYVTNEEYWLKLIDLAEIYGADGFIVTPEMFGARADGITDDTDAFQKALDTKKNVYLASERNYLVTDLYVDNNNIVGNNSTITVSGSIHKTTLSGKLNFTRIDFRTVNGSNPIFTGYTSWIYCTQCSFYDCEEVFLESSGTFVGFSTFSECFFNGCNVIKSPVEVNAFTFYKCSFSNIADIAFKCGRFENILFNGCTFADCNTFIGSYASGICSCEGISFIDCYFETYALFDDTTSYDGNAGYYNGVINIIGGFYNTDHPIFLRFTDNVNDRVHLQIRGVYFAAIEDAAIVLCNKVTGQIDMTYNLNYNKITGNELNLVYNSENVSENTASLKTPSMILTTSDTTKGNIGMHPTYNIPTIGIGNNDYCLIPAFDNGLIASLRTRPLPWFCLCFDPATLHLYLKRGNDFIDFGAGNIIP